MDPRGTEYTLCSSCYGWFYSNQKHFLLGLSKEKVERLRSAQQMISDLDRRRLPKSVHVIHFNPALYKEWLKLDEVKWKNDLIR